MPTWTVPKIWSEDRPVFVVGGGWSLFYDAVGIDPFDSEAILTAYKKGCSPVHIDGQKVVAEYLNKTIGRFHIVGVNNAAKLGAFVDVWWFGDTGYYVSNRREMLQFPGLVASCSNVFKRQDCGKIKYLPRNGNHLFGITTKPNKISWNLNSGSSAINLAYLLGARKIVLVGFDMCPAPEFVKDEVRRATHWHGYYKKSGQKVTKGNYQTVYDRFLRSFKEIAKDAKELGVEIINTSKVSLIKQFPKMGLQETV